MEHTKRKKKKGWNKLKMICRNSYYNREKQGSRGKNNQRRIKKKFNSNTFKNAKIR